MQRRRCTWASVGTDRERRRLSWETGLQSTTCCTTASPPSAPSRRRTAVSQMHAQITDVLIPAEVRSPAPTPVGTGEARALHHFYKWLGMGGTVSRKTANQTVQTITKALTKTTNCNCIAEKSGAARLNFFNVCPPPLSNVLQRHWLWRYIMPGAQEAFINTVKGKNQVI